MAIKPYIIYTHHDRSIKTIGQFLDNFGLSIVQDMTAKELLDYKVFPVGGVTAISNLERVFSQYSSTETTNHEENITDATLGGTILLIGTRLALPKAKLFTEVASIAGFNQTKPISTFDNFLAENHQKLLSDETYYPIDKTDLGRGESLSTQYPNMSVWIWCRSLSPEDSKHIKPDKRDSLPDFLPGAETLSSAEYRRQLVKHFGIDGNLINITPFVITGQTSVDAGGGSFSFSLSPIEGERDKATGWRPSRKTIDAINSKEFVAQSKINRYNKDTELIERSKFLLHNIIQPNDLVFIRFETLVGEEDRRDLSQEYEFLIDKTELAGKAYDMIGLVDSNSIDSSSSTSIEVAINVKGRDLMKLLIEDGSYFYPLAYTNFSESDYGDQKLIRRISGNGKFALQGEYAYRSIQYSSEFIINQVSNITIVPDNLFTSYGDTVSKTLQRDAENVENEKVILDTYKQDIEGLIRNSRVVDKLALDDPAEEQKQIIKAFDNMYNFFTDVKAQDSFLYDSATLSASTWKAGTYNGETVGFSNLPASWQGLVFDGFAETGSIIINPQVFNVTDKQGNAISQATSNGKVNAFANDAFDFMTEFVLFAKGGINTHEPLPMPGIWQIIKLAFDPQIDSLRLADSSISQSDGPLMNQMKKICQEPFVEFYGDTYGDFYYFMFRRPPWNKESISRFNSDYYTSDGKGTYFYPSTEELEAGKILPTSSKTSDVLVIETYGRERPGFVIDIFEADVINDTFSFYDGEVYSFYEISPMASFLGTGSEVSTGYIPIVQIPEYAEIFGSKRLKVVSQYSRLDGDWRFTTFRKQNIIEQAGLELEWLVETNIYLPFTRQGRITINGDRRIKRGTWIRYNPTGELFYVVAVSHSISISTNIDRTTTLQVERGMVEKYIEGAEVEDEAGETFLAGYFEIANTAFIGSYVDLFTTNMNEAGKLMQGFVNTQVLNFFLKRNQFKNEQENNGDYSQE